MKTLIRNIVRKLTAWAWSAEIMQMESIVLLKKLHATPGAMEIHIQQSPEHAQWVAQCFASMVASSENYTEMKFDLMSGATKWDWITVLVQKGAGKTPHELRRIAERQRDEALAMLA